MKKIEIGKRYAAYRWNAREFSGKAIKQKPSGLVTLERSDGSKLEYWPEQLRALKPRKALIEVRIAVTENNTVIGFAGPNDTMLANRRVVLCREVREKK